MVPACKPDGDTRHVLSSDPCHQDWPWRMQGWWHLQWVAFEMARTPLRETGPRCRRAERHVDDCVHGAWRRDGRSGGFVMAGLLYGRRTTFRLHDADHEM